MSTPTAIATAACSPVAKDAKQMLIHAAQQSRSLGLVVCPVWAASQTQTRPTIALSVGCADCATDCTYLRGDPADLPDVRGQIAHRCFHCPESVT